MDATSKRFLDILQAALRDEQPEGGEYIPLSEWQKLFRMADTHKVLPLIYQAVYTLPCLQQAPQLNASVKGSVRQQVMLQAMRTAEFLELNRQLQASGIRPLVVKGIICRNLYPQPDHRLSADEDLLIPPGQFDACHRILTDFGMHTTEPPERLDSAYEVPYRKAGSPLYIELHKHLFPPESGAYGDLNRFFETAQERAVREEIQGSQVFTLGHTDHLFYLICHAFKHFLHSGFGIRQVCDIILYANQYGTRIDWAALLESCRAIRGEKFAAAIFRIGREHLIFDPDRAAYPASWQNISVDEGPMLEDLLTGGLYGDASMSRKHSSSITLEAVTAGKQGRKKKNPIISAAFPSAASLKGRYPYLDKHPALLPFAWTHRLWQYAKETAHFRSSNPSDPLQIGNERIALLRLYGILP